jgi:N,N'-diacetylchitobiose transport system substrate-binding protein
MHICATLAALAAAGLLLTACTGGEDAASEAIAIPSPGTSGALTVWLMDGSQPQTVVDAVNERFAEAYPDVEVAVELQQWMGVQDRLTATLGTDSSPDVVEIGSWLTAKYADAGLLTDLTSLADDFGVGEMLPGAQPSGELDGRRYGIPYYGGVDVVTYNKAQFEEAGVEVPRTLAELAEVAGKLQEANADNEGYSAFYFPGKHWEGAVPFIWTNGGEIATWEADRWRGTLDSAEARTGLTQLKDLVDAYSRAPKDAGTTGIAGLEAFKAGDVGMMIDSWWVPGSLDQGEVKGNVGVFALPGAEAGATAPVFFGGSDLAISARSDQPGLAAEWIKILSGVEVQTKLAGAGVIPNQEAAFTGHERNPFLQVADEAATNSRFTPVSPQWPTVMSAEVLEGMLVEIFTGAATVDQATSDASAELTRLLNG